MIPGRFLQAAAANVILGIAAAVWIFGAPIVPAVVGGVGAGALLYVGHRFSRRSARNASERE